MAGNINLWNAIVKDASWYRYIGEQGIHYEYLLPQGANEDKFYEEAIDVRSRKGSNTRPGSDGIVRRPGAYQPIGDKKFFTYYMINKQKMNKQQYLGYLQSQWLEEKLQRYIDYITRKGY